LQIEKIENKITELEKNMTKKVGEFEKDFQRDKLKYEHTIEELK
jgi:hypothetical protein